ncbi:MAG: glycosyltransferase family 4 protein [Herpetosiphonaceae bacterium]|nr:glycosyltransferase family 4 protein [Herpetosiphonaceae bacterium]
MRILLLSAEYPPMPGGIGDYTVELGHALQSQGAQVAIVTGSGPADPAESAVPVFRRVRGWGRHVREDVQAVMSEWQADILHIQYQTGAYQMKPAINLLPSRLDVPTLVTFHDLRMPYLAPKVAPLRRYVTRLLIESAAAVIVTNAEDQSRLAGAQSLVPDPDIYALTQPLQPAPMLIPIAANIAVQPLADRAALRAQLGMPADGFLVAYFGLINHTKGVDTLIESLQYLPATTRLVMIGGDATSSPDREYAQVVQATLDRLDLHERVIWTGYLSAEDVSRTLQAADAAALPFVDGASYRRGSLLAALAHGLPTITTQPRVPLDPPLRHNHEVLLVDPGDAINLALEIERLGDDPKLHAQLAQAARELARAFRWEAIAAHHLALYKQVQSHRQIEQPQPRSRRNNA